MQGEVRGRTQSGDRIGDRGRGLGRERREAGSRTQGGDRKGDRFRDEGQRTAPHLLRRQTGTQTPGASAAAGGGGRARSPAGRSLPQTRHRPAAAAASPCRCSAGRRLRSSLCSERKWCRSQSLRGGGRKRVKQTDKNSVCHRFRCNRSNNLKKESNLVPVKMIIIGTNVKFQLFECI